MATTTFNGAFCPAVVPDRGKRLMSAPHHYTKQDFLKGGSEVADTNKIGETSLRQSRFKVGFYRRGHAAIQPEADRVAFEARKAERAAAVATERTNILADQSSRHGNIINGELKSNEELAPSRALRRGGYSLQASEMSVDHKIRQRVGAGRFHRAEDDKQRASRLQRQEAALHRQQQTSSLIGYGRNDLVSEGVLDAFSGHGYGSINKSTNTSSDASVSTRRSTDTGVIAAATSTTNGRLRSHSSAPSSVAAAGTSTTTSYDSGRLRSTGRGARGYGISHSSGQGVAAALKPLSNTGAAIVASTPTIAPTNTSATTTT